MKERCVLIGAAGLDWPSLRGVMRRGLVPNLSALAARGGLGSLHVDGPQVGLAPWTTIATGCAPLEHGVYRETERWAGGLRATTRASWQRPPVWATIAAAGGKTGSVDWPGIAPGASWPGRHIDARYAAASAPDWDDWALPRDCAPASMRERLRAVRVHPADISGAQLLPLVPGLAAIDQSRDAGLPMLAVGMARSATIQAGAVQLLGDPDWQSVFIHYPLIEQVRLRGPMAPPWHHVLDGAWRFLDGLIGHIVTLAGPGCTVLVVSPGWQGAAGVVMLAGPGVRPASEIAGARLTDIAPTVLAALGLRDDTLPGRVIGGAIGGSGGGLGGNSGGGRPVLRTAAVTGFPAPPIVDTGLAEVTAAGYTPPQPPSPAWQVDGLIAKAALLLGRAPEAAGEAVAEALALMPDHIGALQLAARIQVMLQDAEALVPLGDAMLRLAPGHPCGSLIHGAAHAIRGDAEAARPWLTAAAEAGDPDTTLRVGAAWLMLDHPDEAGAAFGQVLAHDPGDIVAAVGASMAACTIEAFDDAERPLRQVLARDPQAVPVWLQLAEVMERSGRADDAKAARRTAARFGGGDPVTRLPA